MSHRLAYSTTFILCFTLSLAFALNYSALSRAVARNNATVSLMRFTGLVADSSLTPAPSKIRQMLQSSDVPERMLGVLAEYEGHPDEAIGYYRSAETAMADPLATYMLGRALLRNGDRDSAVGAWLGLGPRAVREMARWYGVLIVQALGRGEWDTVIDLGALALALDPQLSQIPYYVGIAHAQRGDLGQAIDAYKQALETERNPEARSSILKARGDAYAALGDTDRALQSYRSAVEESDKHILALKALADLYLRRGLFDEAYVTYEKILAIDDAYVSAYIGLGDVLRDQSLHRQAQGWYQRARQVDPTSGLGELSLGRLALLEGKPEEAVGYLLEASSRLPPDHRFVWIDLARSHRAAGQLDSAVDAYQRAVDILGDDQAPVWLWVELAETLTSQGNLDRAEKVWEMVLAIDPENVQAIEALGRSRQ